MADINVKFNPSSLIDVLFEDSSDIIIRLNPSSDIAVNIPVNALAFGTEYQVVYDSYTEKPEFIDATRQSALLDGLVSDSVWTDYDIYYNFAIHTNDNGEAQTNWFNPGTFDCTLVNAPAFTAYEGFQFDSASWIDTNWIVSTDSINYLQDSGSLSIYSRTDTTGNIVDIGAADSSGVNETVIYAHRAVSGRISINSSAGLEFGIIADSLGMYVGTRTASNIQVLYKNKAAIINGTNISSGLPTEKLYIGAYNVNGAAIKLIDRQLSMASASAGFTQTKVNNHSDRFETYIDSYSKGVA